jgi:hypothetical protein
MTTPQDRLAAAHASWNAGDLDGYLELYDDAIRLHGYSAEATIRFTILHFDGDRTIERFSQADMLGLMVQMGAIPAPA